MLETGISYYASNDDDNATLDNDLVYKICQWGAKAYEIKLEANPNLRAHIFIINILVSTIGYWQLLQSLKSQIQLLT